MHVACQSSVFGNTSATCPKCSAPTNVKCFSRQKTEHTVDNLQAVVQGYSLRKLPECEQKIAQTRNSFHLLQSCDNLGEDLQSNILCSLFFTFTFNSPVMVRHQCFSINSSEPHTMKWNQLLVHNAMQEQTTCSAAFLP